MESRRRETGQPGRKVGQPQRIEQDVLHTGEEAELMLRGNVNSWGESVGAGQAYTRGGITNSGKHLARRNEVYVWFNAAILVHPIGSSLSGVRVFLLG